MKKVNSLIALVLVAMLAIACSSIFSKMNAEVKKEAVKIAKVGRYKVLQITKDNRRNSAGCECASKVAVILGAVQEHADQQNLCIGAGHSGLSDYESLQKGDEISFEVSDNMLDLDCSESPASFLKVKK